jgi:hypothetical protein
LLKEFEELISRKAYPVVHPMLDSSSFRFKTL